MEGFLNLISGYFGGGVSPYISRIHTAYIGVRIPPFLVPERFGDEWGAHPPAITRNSGREKLSRLT